MPANSSSDRPRILTGDQCTGKLHVGHWIGSVKRRVELQDTHECYFILANLHAFTTRAEKPDEIRADTMEIVRDHLAMGIDPEKASIFLQSEVPAILELTFLFSMLLGFNRVMRNPTLKDEIKVKGLGEDYPFGFPLYAVGQTADILAFRPVAVPVGEDQVPHLELTREVARKFNQLYCDVDGKVEDDDHVDAGGVFPVPRADVGKVGRLMGIDGEHKMSKSLNNAIYISDTAKQVQKKVNKIYTGRQSATEKGDPNNILMQYCEIFIPDEQRVAEIKDQYARGADIGDGHIKQELGAAINELLEPMRERRLKYEGNDDEVIDILKAGTSRANAIGEETLAMAKEAARLGFFRRKLELT